MRDGEYRNYRQDEKKEIFSTRVRAGSRTYYLDIKKNSKNDDYLVISESKRIGGDDNEKQRHRVMVFAEDIEKFSNSFFQIVLYFLENSVETKENEITEFIETFNKVGERLSSLSRYSSYSKHSQNNSHKID